LGCNLDYDKLQDLAEQHRNLRLLIGIGDWEENVDFDWRRRGGGGDEPGERSRER
jgi:hypothetical protein